MRLKTALTFAFFLVSSLFAAPLPGEQYGSAKEALQELQEYIGGWKGNGTSESDKTAIWKENMAWNWRFKGDDSWLELAVKDSKFYKAGTLKYLTDKKLFQLELTDKADKGLVFEGKLNKKYLTLERVDPATKETQQLKLNTASDGDRLVITYALMAANRKVFSKEWQIGMTREGVTLAGGKKGPECVVTGGAGTIMVSYKGATYYVCCSGCRDAFNANPEKIIREHEARMKVK
jgi:YHS domain-containing protein